MDVTEKSNGAPSRLRAVLYGLLSVALWAAVLFLSVRAIISVSKDLEAVRNADSYAGRSFTVSYDDLVYTQLGFGAEGASDEALAREEVVSYFDACVPLICERVFATVTFYLLMLGPFIGAAVFHATRGGEGPFAPRFGIILAAMLAMHVSILVAAFIVSGVPVAFTGPAPIVFIVVSYASAIAGSMVLGSLLARIRFALPAVVVTPAILFFVFSFGGWCYEVGIHLFQDGVFVNRGAFHGPWLPIYGGGVAMIMLCLARFRAKIYQEVVAIVVLCGIVEYFTSYFIEMTSGLRYWDYTGYFLNLNGRICGEGLTVFAIGGAAAVYLLVPVLDTMLSKINVKILAPICIGLVVIFVADIIYSHYVPNTGDGITDYDSYKQV